MSAGSRRDRILASPQWRGRAFGNTHSVSSGFKPGVERPTLRDFLCGGERRVPGSALPLVDPVPTWRTAPASGLRVTWLGHSTLLIEIDGARILTDPVWGERASPLPFAGPRRFHPPPVAIDALPPLDAVIISHDHYDHLDRPTIRALARNAVPFVTSLGVGALLEEWGVSADRITELDWWEQTTMRGLVVTATPAQHFSGRGLKDRNATLWSSFHLRGARHSFYYGADSGFTPEFVDIAARLGPFDAIALEIGAHHPSWGDIHLGPDNAARAWQLLGGALLPIHWGTFNLAMHPWDAPIEALLQLAAPLEHRLLTPKLGAPVEPADASAPSPWWRAVGSAAVEPLTVAQGDSAIEFLPD